jgi:hypothetical protein
VVMTEELVIFCFLAPKASTLPSSGSWWWRFVSLVRT